LRDSVNKGIFDYKIINLGQIILDGGVENITVKEYAGDYFKSGRDN
jgi:hypothetical protein